MKNITFIVESVPQSHKSQDIQITEQKVEDHVVFLIFGSRITSTTVLTAH